MTLTQSEWPSAPIKFRRTALQNLLFSHTAPLVAGMLGLFVGYILNVVIHRIPRMMQRESDNYVAQESGLEPPHQDRYNLLVPRSVFPGCGHRIAATEAIPVISWLALSGKCGQCKTPISPRYPAIELLTGLLSALIVSHFGVSVAALAALLFAYLLLAMAAIDFDTKLLPDDLTHALLWTGLLVNLNGTFVPLRHAVIGAAAGYLALWSVYWLFKLATGKEGMGYGDFKLMAALGAWLGWSMLPTIILLSSLVGALVGIILICFAGRDRNNPIPYGPYIAAAGMIAMLYGDRIAAQFQNF